MVLFPLVWVNDIILACDFAEIKCKEGPMQKYMRNSRPFFWCLWILSMFCLLASCTKSSNKEVLQQTSVDVTHYNLILDLYPTNQLQPENETIQGKCTITFKNNGQTSLTSIPVLFYRLLEVKSVTNSQGQALPFTQKVVKIKDFSPVWQVNKAEIKLSTPIPPGKDRSVTISYGGFIYGYQEVFRYTKDHIGADFIMVREDVFAYPEIIDNSWNSFIAAVNDTFDFDLRVSIPKEYVVANGGWLIEKKEEGDRSVFSFKSQLPDWRIDVAAAKFNLLEDDARNFRVYYFDEDKEGAERILAGMTTSMDLYTKWLGEMGAERQVTVIETPEGSGGQAAKTSILLPAESFSSERNVSQIYHEVAHLWDVPSLDEMQSRWLSEGFANYFMALVLRELDSQKRFVQTLEGLRSRFKSHCEYENKLATTPISDYGKADLTGASYTKGALALYMLHEIVGDIDFKKIFKMYVERYQEKGATLEDFRNLAGEISNKDLKKYFDEWVFGTESSQLLLEELTLQEITQRYK